MVKKFANVLKSKGVKKGDNVAIYLPMVVELPVAMLACARIGAVHSVVFGGFSAEALASRITDCKARILVTADGTMRGKKPIGLLDIADQVRSPCPANPRSAVPRPLVRGEGRSVSDGYGVRDAACPLSTRRGGVGLRNREVLVATRSGVQVFV